MNKKKKALVVTTVASTIDQFCMNDISLLLNNYDVQVAANFTTGNNTSKNRINEFKNELMKKGIEINEIDFDRSPLCKSNFTAYRKLKKIMRHNEFDLIHCHTPIVAMFTRLAANELRKKGSKVIYTAHGFHFYKGAPILNWIIYYPVEKLLARYTDTLITINKEDYDRANSKFNAKRVEYIPGIGINLEKINEVAIDRDIKRRELGFTKDAIIVLSVGELNKNKNHEVIIKAIYEINNPDIHYIICGQGKLYKSLKNLSKELGIQNQVHLFGFRKDVIEICKVSNIFVLSSKREGLSVALMEAMACGLPIVCSNIRGNNDLVENGTNGYLVTENKHYEYVESLTKLIEDRELMQHMKKCNLLKIKEYSIDNVLDSLKMIYSNTLGEK